MGEELILDFFSKYPQISYRRGENVLRPNEYYNHIYLLKNGFIRPYKILKTAQEITVNCYNPKKQKHIIFGYSSRLIDFHLEALTDIVAYRAPQEEFKNYIENNIHVYGYFLNYCQISVDELLRQVEWISVIDAYTRTKMLLYGLSQGIGVQNGNEMILDNRDDFPMKITHQLLASLAGLSRETVSIQLNRLMAQGDICRKNNSLVITNITNFVKDID